MDSHFFNHMYHILGPSEPIPTAHSQYVGAQIINLG